MEYEIRKMNKEALVQELPQLLEIPEPPNEVYIVGQLPKDTIYLSVVGSRRYSDYGQQCCRELILGLEGRNVTIVSGLAYGIDSLAHQAALQAKLKTIAIPGSGLDLSVLYPKGHIELAREIIYNDGCLLSEFNIYEKAAPWTFPQRNRIMAGICRAVLVIEAEEKSGTLITARLATEYNRDVLSVPGSIFSSSSTGTNFLLRQGATPITCANDLLLALGILEENKILPLGNNSEDKKIKLSMRTDVSEQELEIINLLTTSPLGRDEIILKTNKPVHEISATISILEIKGIIIEKFGQLWIN
jgi:DNA processing protein